MKVHLHARDDRKAREDLAAFGKVVRWSTDDLGAQVRSFRRRPVEQAVHIMTDAAGSISRDTAAGLGVTILDSYITVGERSLPETHFVPEELYAAMRRGIKVSTAQASVFERHEHFRSALDRYPRVLYLCVGSAFTGNCGEAAAWQERYDPEGRFTVIDSGAASGRLGLLALAAARFARETRDAAEVIRFVREGVARCQEYVFLDTLRYLAAGGRLSRTGAFFGDMLRMKPVISPLAEGVRKMGVVRNRTEQLKFAVEKLTAALERKRARPDHDRVYRQPRMGDPKGASGNRATLAGGGDHPSSHVPHLRGAYGAGDLGRGLSDGTPYDGGRRIRELRPAASPF